MPQWCHHNKTYSRYSELNSLQNAHFGFYIFWKLIEWCHFVTYLRNDPRICVCIVLVFYMQKSRLQHTEKFTYLLSFFMPLPGSRVVEEVKSLVLVLLLKWGPRPCPVLMMIGSGSAELELWSMYMSHKLCTYN